MPDVKDARDMRLENGVANFLYSGKATYLTRELSKLDFEDVNISDPELDEVFIHYYTREEK